MKRQRQSAHINTKRLGPAAAAMRRNKHVFRDARQADGQLTVNKLLQDAVAMQRFHAPSKTSSTRVMIYSREELALYRQKRRADLEDKVRRGYAFLGNWIKYARWEAQQKDFTRMRDVLQRAVAVHGDNPNLWRDYAELEATNGFVAEARAVFSRGVTSLPAATDLWLKYLILEQTAGEDAFAREVFNRWLHTETPPACAFEVFSLFEAQRAHADACRDVLRRYVETTNTPQAWLFFCTMERRVFGDAGRAVKVLKTALEALPDSVLWGPEDCTIPLTIAEILTESGQIEAARDSYHELLRRLQGAEVEAYGLVDRVLATYSKYERLHGDSNNHLQLSSLAARRMYERRIAANPEDFDARLSLYLLLRDAAATVTPTSSTLEVGSQAALRSLEEAIAIPARTPTTAQQRAVLLMELTRRYDEAGRIDEARQLLASCIKGFPFSEATCPRLWLEASAFEQRHGNYPSARRLLSAAGHVTHDSRIFSASLQLEERAYQMGAISQADYVAEARRIYQNAIKAFPHSEKWWAGCAKFEEKEGQMQRATALYAACVRTLTSAACRAASFAERYELLGIVDRSWGRRLALQRRLIKRVAGQPAEEAAATQTLRDTYVSLLSSVWQDYVFEAVAWRTGELTAAEKAAKADATLAAAVPIALPSVLGPAVARWSEAVGAVVAYAIALVGRINLAEGNPMCFVRDTFEKMVARERQVLHSSLGLTEMTGYDEAVELRAWAELLLSPLLESWSTFEAEHGGSLQTVQAAAVPEVKKRTRLFRKRGA